MEKIPCIECTPELWEYIKPYFEEWGYKPYATFCNWKDYPLLVINVTGKLGIYHNIINRGRNNYDRELVDNVEEFLERAAKLKGFTYKRKEVMKINGIEIEPGMIITTKNNEDTNVWVVFQTKEELSVISYERCSWYKLSGFVKAYMSKIDSIREMSDGCSLLDSKILWKTKTIITIQEIADKLGTSVDCIRINGRVPIKCSFDKEGLLPGMVVELNNNDYAMITYGTSGCLCLSGPNTWFPIECLMIV